MVEIAMKENKHGSMLGDSSAIPDLILDKCPFGCHKKCHRNWNNNTICHRIVCECECHVTKVTTDRYSGPSPVVIAKQVM